MTVLIIRKPKNDYSLWPVTALKAQKNGQGRPLVFVSQYHLLSLPGRELWAWLEEDSQHCSYQQLRLSLICVCEDLYQNWKGRDFHNFVLIKLEDSNSDQGPLPWPVLSPLNLDSLIWDQGLRVRVHGASLSPYSCCSHLGSDNKAAHGGISYAFVVPELYHHSQSRACFPHKQGMYYASL